jgi:cytoskeletal protein CcmA (bactofilin family)
VVAGEVIGDLHVANKVEIQSQARIIGAIHYVSLAMQAGATVSGQLCHRNAPAEVADQGPLLKLV